VKPTELGFKYNIITFRTPMDEDLGNFSAILGDPRGYVERVGRNGYHGIMIKDKIKTKKELRALLTTLLLNFGFDELQTKKALTNTVI